MLERVNYQSSIHQTLKIMKIILPPFFRRFSFYFVTLVGMLLWIAFFDSSNLVTQARMWMKLKDYEGQTKYYTEQLEIVKKEQNEVLGNAQAMEKYAREKYMMKKKTETVFVLVDKDEKLIEEK